MTHLRVECLAVHGFYPRVACLYFDGSNSETSGSLLFVTLLTSCHAMNSSNCEGVKGAFFKIVGFACKCFLLSFPLPLHALFCARPNFPAAKKVKSASNVRKALPKRLLRRLPILGFFFLFLECKRMLTLEINKNEVERAHLVKEAKFPMFLCTAKFNFTKPHLLKLC